MRQTMITFLAGLVIGILVCWSFGRFVTPRLPAALGGTPTLETTVVEKQRDSSRLLLTVRDAATGEAVLVTITEQVDEIGLLVAVGDTVTLRLPPNQPFATDPPIERVQKPDPDATATEEEDGEAAEGDPGDVPGDDGGRGDEPPASPPAGTPEAGSLDGSAAPDAETTSTATEAATSTAG